MSNLPSERGYREIPHTADLGLEVRGTSRIELFTQSALGLCHLLRCEPATDAVKCERTLQLRAPDFETLLIAWLNELIYLCGEHRFCPEQFDIQAVSSVDMLATVYGKCPWHTCRMIKAATFHNLAVDRTSEGYQTRITFDV